MVKNSNAAGPPIYHTKSLTTMAYAVSFVSSSWTTIVADRDPSVCTRATSHRQVIKVVGFCRRSRWIIKSDKKIIDQQCRAETCTCSPTMGLGVPTKVRVQPMRSAPFGLGSCPLSGQRSFGCCHMHTMLSVPDIGHINRKLQMRWIESNLILTLDDDRPSLTDCQTIVSQFWRERQHDAIRSGLETETQHSNSRRCSLHEDPDVDNLL